MELYQTTLPDKDLAMVFVTKRQAILRREHAHEAGIGEERGTLYAVGREVMAAYLQRTGFEHTADKPICGRNGQTFVRPDHQPFRVVDYIEFAMIHHPEAQIAVDAIVGLVAADQTLPNYPAMLQASVAFMETYLGPKAEA